MPLLVEHLATASRDVVVREKGRYQLANGMGAMLQMRMTRWDVMNG